MCSSTSGAHMMNVCARSTTTRSRMPSSLALSTVTLPSLSAPSHPPNSMLLLRRPAMTPTSNGGGGRRSGTLCSPVPICWPAGPSANRYNPKSRSRSASSLPWLGGASITTRCNESGDTIPLATAARRTMPPIECVTTSTGSPDEATRWRWRPTSSASASIGALRDG